MEIVSTGITRGVSKRAAYVFFVALFGAEIGLAALLRHDVQLSALQWATFAFAVFRISRCLAFDVVMEPLRAPFVKTVPHDSGAGDTTCARTDVGAFREVVGELITCPICNSTHVATVLFLLLALVPGPTQVLIAVMAVVGLREMLEPLFELSQWGSEFLRHENGRRHHGK